VDIMETPPTPELLRDLLRALGLKPGDILRKKDPAYTQLGLEGGRHTDLQLIELMAKHPGLIQRPIVVRGKKAVVARPVEAIATLLR
jgi:arsenate reductase